jgi:Fe2+ transport system protein FeoA
MSERSKIMKSLSDIKSGNTVEVVEINKGFGLHHKLADMGIYPGVTIDVIRNAGHGPIIISRNGIRFGLGYGMAKRIFVKD